MDIAYKIQLFNFISKISGITKYYAWWTHPDFEKDLKKLELTGRVENNVFYTGSSKFDRDLDMDLFKATVMYNRLVKLGVECEIVEINYNDCRD